MVHTNNSKIIYLLEETQPFFLLFCCFQTNKIYLFLFSLINVKYFNFQICVPSCLLTKLYSRLGISFMIDFGLDLSFGFCQQIYFLSLSYFSETSFTLFYSIKVLISHTPTHNIPLIISKIQ